MNGTEVILIDDPSRHGHLTGSYRERPDGKVYRVRWYRALKVAYINQ